jgi:hypothetical protein
MVHKFKKTKENLQIINHEEYITPFNELGIVKDVKGTDTWKLHQKAFLGDWNQSDKDRIFEGIRGNSFFRDSIPLQGVRFNFRPVLKRFWVKSKYGDINEYYAPNKMSIRNNIYFKNEIGEIKEL